MNLFSFSSWVMDSDLYGVRSNSDVVIFLHISQPFDRDSLQGPALINN
jgi:hypothetical protein